NEVGDHRDRNRIGVFRDQIGGTPRDERVDPLMRQSFDAGGEPFDPPRDECAIDEIAQPRVLGWLELQHGMSFERVERFEMRPGLTPAGFDRAAEAAVAQKRRNVGEAREAPEAVVLPEERRRGGADCGVGRIGIVEEFGVARVEAHAALCNVDSQGHFRCPNRRNVQRPREIVEGPFTSPIQAGFRRRANATCSARLFKPARNVTRANDITALSPPLRSFFVLRPYGSPSPAPRAASGSPPRSSVSGNGSNFSTTEIVSYDSGLVKVLFARGGAVSPPRV